MAMEAFASTNSRTQGRSGYAPSYKAEHGIEGVEETVSPPSPPGLEKPLDSSMDLHSDTSSIPSLTRSSTFSTDTCTTASTYTAAPPGTPAIQNSKHESIFPMFRNSRRISTWPMSNRTIRVPPTSSESSSTTRRSDGIGFAPIVECSPGTIEDTYTSSGSPTRRHSFHQEQTSPGYCGTSPSQGPLDQAFHAASRNVHPSALTTGAQLCTSNPSEMTTLSYGVPKDAAATTPRAEPLAGYTAGVDQLPAVPDFGPYEHGACWDNNNMNIYGSWPTGPTGSSELSLNRKVQLPKIPTGYREESPKRQKKPYHRSSKSLRTYNTKVKTNIAATECPLDERNFASLDRHSDTSVDPSTPNRSEEMRQQGVKMDCGDSPSPDDQEGDEKRSPCSLKTSDSNASSPSEEYKPSDEDDEWIYQKLVESITNAVIESPCIDDPEDSGVPLELYIHHFLERVCNYKGANIRCRTSEFPFRDLPLRTCNPGANVGNSRVSRGCGDKGNGSNKKRKNGEDSNSGRGAGDQENPYDDGGDDVGDDPERAKKQKTEKNLSCPFRKRNPVRFNVRRHSSCALVPYQSIALLKRHIKSCHSLSEQPHCPRCRRSFQSDAEVGEHLRAAAACEVSSDSNSHDDPEDGLTKEVMGTLLARNKIDKVSTWKKIWDLIFPEDKGVVVREQFDPPVELDEVQARYCNRDTFTSFHNESSVQPPVGGHGYVYFLEVIRQCRSEQHHDKTPAMDEIGKGLLEMVVEVLGPGRVQSPAPQTNYVADLWTNRHAPSPTISSPNSPNALTGYSSYLHRYGGPSGANPNMELLSPVQNTQQHPQLLPFLRNTWQEASENGALPKHQNTNLPSEHSTAVDSAYGSSFPGQGQDYVQDHTSGQDQCPPDSQAMLGPHVADLNYMGQDMSTDGEKFNKPFSGQGRTGWQQSGTSATGSFCTWCGSFLAVG